MTYVYLLQSVNNLERKYVGLSFDPEKRLEEHNLGQSIHTNKFKPWKMVAKFGFEDEQKTFEFERYLKQGSGHAFAKRHFWEEIL